MNNNLIKLNRLRTLAIIGVLIMAVSTIYFSYETMNKEKVPCDTSIDPSGMCVSTNFQTIMMLGTLVASGGTLTFISLKWRDW